MNISKHFLFAVAFSAICHTAVLAQNDFAQAAAKELRKAGVSWIDARPGHTESGLASRAIFGTAPNFGQGKSVQDVVARMISGVIDKERDLPSTSF